MRFARLAQSTSPTILQSRVQLCYLFMCCDLLSVPLSLQTKQFADKDNADLFAEEAAQQREVRLCLHHYQAEVCAPPLTDSEVQMDGRGCHAAHLQKRQQPRLLKTGDTVMFAGGAATTGGHPWHDQPAGGAGDG